MSNKETSNLSDGISNVTLNGDDKDKDRFWKTMPVIQRDQDLNKVDMHCPIDTTTDSKNIRQEPYNMPGGFEWSEIDVTDPVQLDEVYGLLKLNYVGDNTFKIHYSKEFLTWAFTPPGYKKEYHLGVRSSKSKKLVALITGLETKIRVYEKVISALEINYLCVHKKLRDKRLAPVLIKEIRRRAYVNEIYQAIYTTIADLPGANAKVKYYHRKLDMKVMYDMGWTDQKITLARTMKKFRLPAETKTPGLRPMTPEDIPSAYKLLTNHMKKFDLIFQFTEEEFAYFFLPRENIMCCYVAVSEKTGEVTDLCSFYILPSRAFNQKIEILEQAYSWYNVATSVSFGVLIKDALTIAKNMNLHTYCIMDIMGNGSIFDE